MAKKQFKAESKRLLDLMINSIYTHNEIFLRELISNASDATDKLYYNAMKEGQTGITRESLPIEITIDKGNRQLRIFDHGCGMTAEELETNLGTIAHSGSLSFKKDVENSQDIDIIGQFGVGFYAAFMVAKEVRVTSLVQGEEHANCWISNGADGYTLQTCEKENVGTEIVLTLKDNTDEESYDEYLDQYRIQSIVKKYSDYIRYPIKMELSRSRLKEGCDPEKPEFEDYSEMVTLNSMIPIWKKNKSELQDEDYNSFYKSKYYDFEDPLCHIHSSTEGSVTYQSLLFVPARAPFDYYTKDYQRGLQLYSNGVMIMDKCADLVPDYFGFIRGLVDSQDLSLNISREMLQHDRHLKLIEQSLEKKIKNELLSLQKNHREEYEKFFKAFGSQIKYGIYADYGAHKDVLEDLLVYRSTSADGMITLNEYVERMKEDQKYIYYACGETAEKIALLPAMELLRDQGYEVLYMTDRIDEFAVKTLIKYKDKEFQSITDSDFNLATEAEKEQIIKLNEEHKDVLEIVKDALGEKVQAVRLTGRLKSHPCCLTSDGPVSLEMEKVLKEQALNEEDKQVHANRILELNASHSIFQKLQELSGEKQKMLSEILYNQALLIEGIEIEDPVAYTNAVCRLLTEDI